MPQTVEEALAQTGQTPQPMTVEEALLLHANKREPYTPLRESQQDGPQLPPEIAAMKAAGSKEAMKKEWLRGGLMALGGFTGGALAGGAAGAAGAGSLLRLGAQTIGEYGGIYGGARVGGMSPEEARKAAGTGAAFGLAGGALAGGGTWLAGKAAGISPKAFRAGMNAPGKILKPLGEGEHLELAKQLEANTKIQAENTTFGHEVYQTKFLGPFKDVTLDAKSYAEIIRSQITGGDHPSVRAADRALETMANRLEGRAIPNEPETVQISESRYSNPVGRFSGKPSQSAVMGRYNVDKTLPPTSSGRMKAGDVDAWISENLTDPLHGAYTRGSEAIVANRLMKIRTAMAEKLYQSLGPGASSAQKLAQRSLTIREATENTFGLGTEAKPSGTGADKIRTIRSGTGQAQMNRQTLAKYDAEHGTSFLKKADELSMRTEWSGKDMMTAYAIDSALQPTRPGFVKGVSLPVARAGARLWESVGPSASAMAAYMKRRKAEDTEKSPEQMFPGLTNIGDNK